MAREEKTVNKKDDQKHDDYKKGKGLSDGVRPKYRLCWLCNRQFRGNHFTAITIDGHERHVHKTCAEEYDREPSY